MQLNVGVLLVKANGQVALPHSLCAPGGMGDAAADAVSCLDKLKDFVGRLKEEPLLLKAYTAQARALPSHLHCHPFTPVAPCRPFTPAAHTPHPPRSTAQAIVAMQDRFEEGEVADLAKKAGLEITPIDEHFSDLSKLGHSSLRHYAIYLLERLLATADEALIAAACTPSKKEEQAFFPTFSMGQLLLKNARYFPGMTLTVSPNPLEQIRSTAETLVKEFPSLKKLNKEMEAEEAALQKRLDGIRKEAEKVKGGEDRVEEIIASKLRDMGISESAGTLKIPEHCVVNSRAHLKKYAEGLTKAELEEYDGSFFRSAPTRQDFKAVDALPVEDVNKMLLVAGVAAHMPYAADLNPQGDTSYTNYVAEQMEGGKLAVCGVTKDFTYGANVPCTSVLVDKDFSTNHSANTLRQFIGRVARTGLAPFGVAQFEDDTFLPKMCGKQENLEALSMEATAKAIIFPDEGK